jgi:hypothetical protein
MITLFLFSSDLSFLSVYEINERRLPGRIRGRKKVRNRALDTIPASMSATDILRLYPDAHREIYRAGFRDYLAYQKEKANGASHDVAFRRATKYTFGSARSSGRRFSRGSR